MSLETNSTNKYILHCSRLREKIVDFVLGKFELQVPSTSSRSEHRDKEELISSV